MRAGLDGDRYRWMAAKRLAHVKSLATDSLEPLFATLMMLRNKLDWGPAIKTTCPDAGSSRSSSDPQQLVFMIAGATLASLCEVDFKPVATLAEPILRLLLTTPYFSFPRDMASDHKNLNILRQLNQVFKAHADPPEGARPRSIALAERALTSLTHGNPALLTDNAVPAPKAQALMALAGLRRGGFSQRMRRLPPPRLGLADFHGRYSTVLPLFERISARSGDLIDELCAAGGKPG